MSVASAQTPAAGQTPGPESRGPRIGVQGLGFAGFDWPRAEQSVEALGLDEPQVEFGGGVRMTNLWRALFVEVHASRWSTTGDRAFVDSSGTAHPLGIPLDVDATHVDVTAGWRFLPRNPSSIHTAIPYIGAGAGIVRYREESPFAEPGDDLHTSTTSYHIAVGADVPLNRWLAVAADLRYRFAPDVLGEGGVSQAFEEDDLGGLRLSVGVRVGFGGTAPVRPKRTSPPTEPDRVTEPPPTPPGVPLRSGVIAGDAPVYLLPDRTRVPLRVLENGTTVRIIEEIEGWVRIEFRDPQYGPRVGYVESRLLRR